MAGRRNPKRWVIQRLGEADALTGFQLAQRFRITESRGPIFRKALHDLVDSGHIIQTADHHYRLTELGQGALMRIRNSKQANVIDLAKEKERLLLDFFGVHGVAIQTVEDDDVLSERLALAIADEMPPIDLSEVPLHRRPQHIEDQIDLWMSMTKLGPCSYCGSRTKRHAPLSSVGYLDATPTDGFTVRADATKSCGWCSDFLSTHTLAEFRETIFNAVSGARGIPVIGMYRHNERLVPFAHEVQFAGTPWGYITQHRVGAIWKQAHAVVHPKRFCTTPEQARQVSIPGLQAPHWDPAALARPKRVFRPLVDAVRAEEERLALEERRKQNEKGKTINRHRRNEQRDRTVAVFEDNTDALKKRAKELGIKV